MSRKQGVRPRQDESPLKDEELVSIVLEGTARRAEPPAAPEGLLAMPQRVLTPLDALKFWDEEALRSLWGPKAARRLAACLEIGRRLFEPGRRLDSPRQVFEAIPSDVRSAPKEYFLAFYLNSRAVLVHSEVVSIGSLTASLVHPREVLSPALERRCCSFIVAHNHPSGELSPSPEDVATTRRLKDCGDLMGIPLMDHVIVCDRGFFSFREKDLLA